MPTNVMPATVSLREDKRSIRKEIKFLKDNTSFTDKQKRSKIIFSRVEHLDVFKEAKVVLHFWSLRDEVYTHDTVMRWAKDKKVLLPCVKGDTLVIREFKGINAMKMGDVFGIPEPTGRLFKEYDKIDLAIIPGVAFDHDNNRLGRGRAFYDRLLKQMNVVKIGVCFDFQLLETIPVKVHDIKMDMVITN